MLFRAPLFWISGVESPLIFLYKKKEKEKNKYIQIHYRIVPFINKIKNYIYDILENYIALGPSYNLPK